MCTPTESTPKGIDMPRLVAFQHPQQTFLMKRDTLTKASSWFADVLLSGEDECIPVIKEDCHLDKIGAFIKVMGWVYPDELSVAFKDPVTSSPYAINECLHLVHKYDCEHLKTKCFEAIEKGSKRIGGKMLWSGAAATFEQIYGNDPKREYDFGDCALEAINYYYERKSHENKLHTEVSHRTLVSMFKTAKGNDKVKLPKEIKLSSNILKKKKKARLSKIGNYLTS